MVERDGGGEGGGALSHSEFPKRYTTLPISLRRSPRPARSKSYSPIHSHAAYIEITDGLHSNYLVLIALPISEVGAARGSTPRHIGCTDRGGQGGPPFSRKGRSLTMTNHMFATIRTYNGVPTLTEELVKHEDDIKAVLSPIAGFRAYYLIKTSNGAVSMTVCTDRAGAEESNRVAATWLKDKLPRFATTTPLIVTGDVQIHMNGQTAPVLANTK
jgi:hypothetical protein